VALALEVDWRGLMFAQARSGTDWRWAVDRIVMAPVCIMLYVCISCMYVCMYVCIMFYVCVLRVYVFLNMCLDLDMCMCVCVYVHAYEYIHMLHVSLHDAAYKYLQTDVYIYIRHTCPLHPSSSKRKRKIKIAHHGPLSEIKAHLARCGLAHHASVPTSRLNVA